MNENTTSPITSPASVIATDTKQERYSRYKLTQACDSCRSKRIKCDGQYPRCSACNSKEISCTYLLDSKRRGPKSLRIRCLEKRLEELEARLNIGGKGLDRNEVGFSGKVNIIYVFYLAGQEASGSQPSSHLFDEKQPGSTRHKELAVGSDKPPDLTLPDKAIVNELIQLFFSITHPTIRFVHKATLLSRLDSENKPYLLLNAIFALSARFSTHPQVCVPGQPRYLNGELFAQRLLSHLSPLLLSQPTLDTVQALILLGLHEYGKMQGFSSWSYIGIAIRLAQQLGLHMIDSYHNKDTFVHRPGSEDWLMTECKRRTWWGCFIADRFASSLVGRSMYIDLRDCLVQLPSADGQWDHRFGVISQLAPSTMEELVGFGADLSGARSVFCSLSAHFVALVELSGKVTCYLMHRAARTQPYDPDYQELIILDQQILVWLTGLPEKFHKPQDFLTLANNEPRAPEEMGSDIFRAVACMFAMYHETVIALHRGNLAHAQRDNPTMVRLSKQRCIAAANQIAQLVEDAWHRIDDMGDPFYPFSIFNAATIHANYIYLEPLNTAQALLSRRHLATCTQALEHLAEIWLMSQTYLNMLQTLITSLSLDEDSQSISHSNSPSHGIWEVFSISYFDWFFSISSMNPTNHS